ncbi:MAG TPA: flagellar basal body rod protein FlgC [candidate division Zixibacteria bacterium]|nr:flagellar basal body rod protein FlgC [candidate division Zixibacteria bacterium]
MTIGALTALSVAADGLAAQRHKMNTVAENIAKAQTTRTPEGGPYRRQKVVFKAASGIRSFTEELQSARLTLKRSRDGHRVSSAARSLGPQGGAEFVSASSVAEGADSLRMVYDPSHPDANADGYVAMPNVEVITEMVDLMSAQRAYEANLTSVEAVKSMIDKTLEI